MRMINYRTDQQILDDAPELAVTYCMYDYGNQMEGNYLSGEDEYWDEDEMRWVDTNLVDDLFHSHRRISDISRIVELEQWIAGIADYHSGIPDRIQQSAMSVLTNNAE